MLTQPMDRALVEILKTIDESRKAGDLRAALRAGDRAWRTMPAHAATIAPVLGRLLLEDSREPLAAANILLRAAELAPAAAIEADLIRAMCMLGQTGAASSRLTAALQRYAVAPDDALAALARELIDSSVTPLRGWAALTPDMFFHLELRSPATTSCFVLHAPDGSVLATQTTVTHDGWARARFAVAAPAQPQLLRFSADGLPLAAGERVLPVDFRLQGHCTASGRAISGDARLAWAPTLELSLELRDEQGKCRRLRTRAGRYRIDADRAGLGDEIRVCVQLPDGRSAELPDSPIVFKRALDRRLRKLQPQSARAQGRAARRSPPVDVVIPVYSGRDETLACIESVCRSTAGVASTILVIDDATPEPALAADLDALARSGRITLLRNTCNLGFAASVNRAMAVNPTHDAVLVNADAIVFGDWLERLRRAACRQPGLATITAFSDDDSVARCTNDRAAASAALAAELDAYAACAHRGQSVELPSGVGFCMYLRREAWRDVGEFDAATFGQGYGEECDWCMRAHKRGWQHHLAADVVVHHAGGRSFGARRMPLMLRANRLMNLRHPGYDAYVQQHLRTDPLQPLRRSFDVHRLRSQTRPIVLMVMLALTGGVDRYVGERCRRLREQGKFPLVLRPLEVGPESCMLWSFEPRLLHLHYAVPGELRELRALLRSLPVESIELHHFLGLDARLVEAVIGLGIPYEAHLHDYSWICPRVTLIDHSGRYCGEPALAACERCVRRNGSDLMEPIGVAALRRRSARWLRKARRVIVPSQDAAHRYARYLPDLRIEAEPLEPATVIPPPPVRRPRRGTRVALLGAIGQHKGYRVMLACARDARARGLDLEFVVIGFTENDGRAMRTGRVFVTGEYRENEAAGLIRRESPDLIWLPSVWPETWCYVLSHALASGLPVVAFDIGAIAERMRSAGTGVLLPLDTPPERINDRLVEIAAAQTLEEPLFG